MLCLNFACDADGRLHLKLEQIQPRSSDIDLENRTSILLAQPLAVMIRRSGDDQFRLGKLDASDVSRRELHLPHNLPLRVDLDDSSLAVDGVPDVAVDVDAEPVWASGALVLIEDAAIRHVACVCVVVKGVDLADGGVGKVHGLAVGRPAD